MRGQLSHQVTPSVVAREAGDVGPGLENVVCRPPRLLTATISTARGIGAGRRRGVDPTLVVGLEDAFARGARVRDIPSVEPAITERFGGVVFGCHGWGGIRSESCLFGWLLRRSRAKC